MTMKINTDTKVVTFEGEIRWATLPPGNPKGVSAEYAKDDNRDDLFYMVNVECSKKEFEELSAYKLPKLVELKEDTTDKTTWVTLKTRKVKTNTNPAKNEGKNFIFPDVTVIDRYNKKIEVAIANGSKAMVRAKLIETSKGHTLQLLGVMVTELIPYERANVFDDVIEEDPNPFAAEEAHSYSNEQLDDDVPF